MCAWKSFSQWKMWLVFTGGKPVVTRRVCLYKYIQTKMFAWLMITFAVIMTSTVKFCPSIEDTIFPPYEHVSKYSVWSWGHHEFWTEYGFPVDSFVLLVQLHWYQRILGTSLAYGSWLCWRFANLFHRSWEEFYYDLVILFFFN